MNCQRRVTCRHGECCKCKIIKINSSVKTDCLKIYVSANAIMSDEGINYFLKRASVKLSMNINETF